MKRYILGDQQREDIVFAVDQNRIWPARLWQMLCLSDEKGLGVTARSAGPAIISCSRLRYEADDFRLIDHSFNVREARLEWETSDGKLRLQSQWHYDLQAAALSRCDRLINSGKEEITIFRCLPRFVFPPDNYEIYFQSSRWCNESQGQWRKLHAGAITLSSAWGRSTEGSTPYLCLRAGDRRRGIVFHVIPRGNWVIRVTARLHANLLPVAIIEAGLSDEDLRLGLSPGEGIDLPEIIMQALPQGIPEEAAPYLHCYLNQRAPLPQLKEAPVIYNTWFDSFDDLDVNRLRAQLKAASAIGCEVFVVDAGWFGPGTSDWSAVGDWREKTERAFCGKMKNFADEVRLSGLGFGLWMEPERYAANIPIRKQHPEWFVPGAGRIRMEKPEVRAYLAGEIARLIETYQLAWLKFDQNASPGYDETGAELYNYYSAWCGLLDDLRRRYPRTVFENCAGGAMRHDLSSLFHFDVHMLSDTVNPMDVLRISQGDLLRMPPGRILRWAVLKPAPQLPLLGSSTETRQVLTPGGATWNTAETAELDFVTIAALCGALGFSGDLHSLEDAHKKRLRWYVDFYKKWRGMILTSRCHLLTPVRPLKERTGWTVLQLQSPETSASIIFQFYKPNDGEERRLVQVRNLDPAAKYRVRRINPDGQTELEMTGDKLMRIGLELSEPYFMHSVFKAGITTLEPIKSS